MMRDVLLIIAGMLLGAAAHALCGLLDERLRFRKLARQRAAAHERFRRELAAVPRQPTGGSYPGLPIVDSRDSSGVIEIREQPTKVSRRAQ